MNVAKVIEISAESNVGFKEAIQNGITKAAETVHNIQSAWVKEQQVTVADGEIVKYRVHLKITFVMD